MRLVRRAGAIATAILLVVCTVAVQTQEVAVAHVRCHEHGQLIHVTGVTTDSADRAPGMRSIRPGRGAAADHEHCPVAGTTHCTFTALTPPAAAIVATVAFTRVPIASEHAARTTFRLAPKTSPPG
jgi:hypothetical protein